MRLVSRLSESLIELVEKLIRANAPRSSFALFFSFQPSQFDDAVVQPTHRPTTDRFFVEDLADFCPTSRLPNDHSMTFEKLYK